MCDLSSGSNTELYGRPKMRIIFFKQTFKISLQKSRRLWRSPYVYILFLVRTRYMPTHVCLTEKLSVPLVIRSNKLIYSNQQQKISLGFFTSSPQYKNVNIFGFICVIRKKLYQRSLQPWNVILSHLVMSNFIFTHTISPCVKFRKYSQIRQLSENTFQSFNMEVYEKIFFLVEFLVFQVSRENY